MVLGVVWHVYCMYSSDDKEVGVVTCREPLRTLTNERLEKIKKDTGLKFDDEDLYWDDVSYKEYLKRKKLKVVVEIVTDDSFSQFDFNMSKEAFIDWCNGDYISPYEGELAL